MAGAGANVKAAVGADVGRDLSSNWGFDDPSDWVDMDVGWAPWRFVLLSGKQTLDRMANW